MSGGPPGTGAGWDVSFQPGILQDLWEAIPPGMRLAYFSAGTLPEEYRGGLAHQRGRTAGIDLSPLPAAIRQELAWCMFRIITRGGKVDVTHMRALVRRLGEVISDLGAAAPVSLTSLAPREWQQQFALAVRRRTGALPGPGSVSDLRQQLGRCWRLLAAAYDTRPWWQREVWTPAADPRIPQRPHEPRRHSADFGQITTGWLRLGLQWHCKVGLETGTLAWGTVELRVAAATVFDAFLAGRAVPGPRLADEPGPGAGADAGLPRPPARPAGPAPWQAPRPATVGLTCRRADDRRRAVLRVHARPPRHCRRGAGRAGLAAAGPAACHLLPPRRETPHTPPRPRP